ncbi:MAG: SCO family protein [Planctomycetes bacterium]|nr:SCO family protein [Planctomycetota bacterium]
MNKSALPYWLSLMVIIAASYGGWTWWRVQQFEASRAEGGIQTAGPPLKEFELTERSGKQFRSRDMLGKVWVTSFFFASCPGTCPRLNANIKYLNSLEELQDVTWVSITVDPDTDTLSVLSEYAKGFQADPERWLFCRGDLGYIKRVGKDVFSLPINWKGHNEHAVVIDKFGKVRGMYDASSRSQSKKLALLLKECLAEEAPPKDSETI